MPKDLAWVDADIFRIFPMVSWDEIRIQNIMTTPPPLPPVYVGFWARVVAMLIDTGLISLIIFPPLVWIYGWEYLSMDEDRLVAGLADLLLSWILPIAFFIGFWIVKRATPGKLFLAAEIVDAKSGGNPRIYQWVLRYLGYFVSTIPFGLGLIWIAFDRRKQGWHDKIAGTVVIRKPSDPA